MKCPSPWYNSTMMDPELLAAACHLYTTSPDQLTPLTGGHYAAVYQFPCGDKPAVLRIGVTDCPAEQTLGMLEWVSFLSREGAPVSAPVTSINSRAMENLTHAGTSYTLTAFEKSEGTLAENIPPSAWTGDLFSAIGRAVGKFHRLSKRYTPSSPALTRLHWFDSYELQAARKFFAASSHPAGEKLASLVSVLKLLPANPVDFGLIHNDLHFANFLVLPAGQVTIVDFDDCAYGWFAMDIAMALFDVLVLYNAPTEDESRQFARLFLSSYLAGYRRENELSPFFQNQIPYFLKLKELCVYADVTSYPGDPRPDSWSGRFLRGRAERIAEDVPYVDIDFTQL